VKVLVINCGSSSAKYQLMEIEGDSKEMLARGVVERIGGEDPVVGCYAPDNTREDQPCDASDHDAAFKVIVEQLGDTSGIYCVGHRVVHGGEAFVESALITDDVIQGIEEHIPLSPLHNPANLAGIRAAQKLLPDVPHVAVFDTSFHQAMPDYAYMYGVDYSLYEHDRVRRYGFHGTSHRFVSTKAAKFLDIPYETSAFITCHLGNGCSVAAIKNGRSLDTSMGMTPLEGLMMGTRSGDVDPAVVEVICNKEGISVSDVINILNRKSGLLGVSGLSNDMREVCEAAEGGHERARLAVNMFCYRIRKYIGAYLAVNGHTDALVFAGGIGENAISIRKTICDGLEELGLVLDDERNSSTEYARRVLSTDDSPIAIVMIPTDEEWLIADDSLRIAQQRQSVIS
jgi:acetate kinase